MAQINPGIFKKYDIRGKAQGEKAIIDRQSAYLIGQAYASFLLSERKIHQVVVGRDNRHSSYDLQASLMEGLQRGGASVLDIGLVSTPVVYWHAVNQGHVGGIMVTGSHLTPEYNGFKLCIGGTPVFGKDIEKLRMLIEGDKLLVNRGDYAVHDAAYSDYVHDIHQRLPISRKIKLAFDPANGTAGLFAPRLFQLWEQDATGINVQPDGDFPNHLANPQEAENMQQLSEKVLEIGAEIGFGYDGDADRVGIVDEKGQMIAADRVLALLARDMLKRQPKSAIVADVLSSQTVFDVVRQAGGRPIMAASGHSLVKETMRENNSLLGGEMSGHIFFGEDYFGFDDAYFATGRILQILQNSDTPLSEMNNSMPSYYSTPEYRPHCPDEAKQEVINAVAERLANEGEIVTVDGVRVQFAKGWGILRASNTEPVLSLRFEGETEADAIGYRELFAEAMKDFSQVESFVQE
jgi:phosphomannomutase / phosphoglucomutase